MAKKDEDTHLDVKRTEENPESSSNQTPVDDKQDNKTNVKNANAAGLGAIGRNDQKPDTENTGINNY